MAMAAAVAAQLNVALVYDRSLNQSPARLFKQTAGIYLVQLKIVCNSGTDYHCVTYIATTGHLIDNEPRASVPKVTDSDRLNNKSAIAVFFRLFPNAREIWVDAVSSARVIND